MVRFSFPARYAATVSLKLTLFSKMSVHGQGSAHAVHRNRRDRGDRAWTASFGASVIQVGRRTSAVAFQLMRQWQSGGGRHRGHEALIQPRFRNGHPVQRVQACSARTQ